MVTMGPEITKQHRKCTTQGSLSSQACNNGDGHWHMPMSRPFPIQNGKTLHIHTRLGQRTREIIAALQTLMTKQTGPAGKPVNTLYIANKMKLKNEMYFAILLDRATMGPMIIACSEGACV